MSAPVFELVCTEDFSLAPHERAMGDLDDTFAWGHLETAEWTTNQLAWAQHTWLHMAYSEYHSAPLMAQLVTALGRAMAPLNITSMAARFVIDELRHAELCARVCTQLGGAPPVPLREAASLCFEPDLSPRQQASGMILSVCCVSEAVSFRVLQARSKAAGNPVIRKVLQRMVKDEAIHSRLGWAYFDWLDDELDECERQRLGEIAERDINYMKGLASSAPHQALDHGRLNTGLTFSELNAFGEVDRDAQTKGCEYAIAHDIIPELRRRGFASR